MDALAVIQQLDVLSERLWSEYADQIKAELCPDPDQRVATVREQQTELGLDDDCPL